MSPEKQKRIAIVNIFNLCQSSSQTRSFQDGCASFFPRCVNIKMVSDPNENNKGN